ncbi:MAG: DUF2344 domain-containing protein [Firmicutes bacterium]|nr:DUF2344 domain-containing protein [Bacillota bacterium]
MRLILCYEKKGPMAFIAHLDFQQLWWRIFRLAGMRLEMTKGYNPRPRMRFALPLATGFQGERELLEVFLETEEENVVARLNKVMPRGLSVLTAAPVADTYPKITALVDAVAYRVELPASLPDLHCVAQAAGDYLLAADQKEAQLTLLLKVDNQRSVRPDNIAAVCFPERDPADFAITRTGIYTRKNEKKLPLPAGLLLLD